MAGLTTLKERRERLCAKYVDRLQDHSLSLLLPKVEQVGHGYQLRVKNPVDKNSIWRQKSLHDRAIKSIFNFQILIRLSFYKEMYWIVLLYMSFRIMKF